MAVWVVNNTKVQQAVLLAADRKEPVAENFVFIQPQSKAKLDEGQKVDPTSLRQTPKLTIVTI